MAAARCAITGQATAHAAMRSSSMRCMAGTGSRAWPAGPPCGVPDWRVGQRSGVLGASVGRDRVEGRLSAFPSMTTSFREHEEISISPPRNESCHPVDNPGARVRKSFLHHDVHCPGGQWFDCQLRATRVRVASGSGFPLVPTFARQTHDHVICRFRVCTTPRRSSATDSPRTLRPPAQTASRRSSDCSIRVTSLDSAASVCARDPTVRTACMTVVWSRPPK